MAFALQHLPTCDCSLCCPQYQAAGGQLPMGAGAEAGEEDDDGEYTLPQLSLEHIPSPKCAVHYQRL